MYAAFSLFIVFAKSFAAAQIICAESGCIYVQHIGSLIAACSCYNGHLLPVA